MAQKPAIPKGTRDFLPAEVAKRNYIFDTIKTVFKQYGFAPIETPSFERSETLMGKYGEEGDRLIFRILNSGEKMKKADLTALAEENLPRFANSLSEKALRYDLTVPFARFVVQHQNDIQFPFKRYQIQPVWRADRPQHGRYQEFYQCDADVVGTDSLLMEVEFIQIFDQVLSKLGLKDFTIKLNNRKILSGIAEITNEKERLIDITVAIDKLDKIGAEAVLKEMSDKGVSHTAISKIQPLLSLSAASNEELMTWMKDFLKESEIGLKGVAELQTMLDWTAKLGLTNAKLVFDVTLARGLNYYTGAIFEVEANGVKMGSICGGGRYDDLTGLFGKPGLPGVGISFGADRIYDVMQTLDLFPKELISDLDVLFLNFGEKEMLYILPFVQKIRAAGFNAEIYPDVVKLKKQMKYADDRKVKFAIIAGEEEINKAQFTVKNMTDGEQQVTPSDELIDFLKENFS